MDTNPGRKSLQAATEYLIIYCAAILIIAIVMVSLYTVFVAPQSKVPNSCIFSGGFTCGDLLLITNSITSNTVMTLFLTNAGDAPILSPTAWASIAGVNTSSSKCLPNYVKAGGSILCSLNLTAKSASTRLISGKIYVSDQNCAFSASATCQNSANQIFVGSFVGTAQQNGAIPGIQISAATGPVLALTYFSVSSQLPQYVAFSPISPLAYVVTPAISNVVAVNTGTSTATANIPIGLSSSEGYFNAQGTLAYVLDYVTSNVAVINPASSTVVNTISITNPSYAAFNSSGGLAYVVSEYSGKVTVINTANSAVIKTITVGSEPVFAAFSPAAPLAYVVNYVSGTVTAINTANSAIISNIPVGSYPQTMAFNPSGTAAYVPNSGGSTVSVINTANSAVTSVNVGPNPYAVVFNPSGTLAYVDNSGGNTLSVINTATLSVNTITLDSRTDIAPGTMALSPSGSFLYISNSYGNTISLVDTATNAVGTIALGYNPLGVFFNPQGTLAYILKGSNVITVVDLTKYPSTSQKYGLLVTLTIAGGPFRGATINFSTPNSYFGISPKYVVTNASGQALTYITTSLPGSTGTVYANLTNAISANVQVTFR
jgi:YVTN family beta-propeller protein